MVEHTSYLINGRFLARRATGVDRFARETVLALDAVLTAGHPLSSGMRWKLLAPAACSSLPPLRSIVIESSGAGTGVAWEQFHLPRKARGSIVVNLCNIAPLALRRQAVVVHDVAPLRVPTSYSASFGAWYRFAIPLLCRRSAALFTVSEFSAAEIIDCCCPPQPPIVIPEGCEHILAVEADHAVHDRLATNSRPYILAVGSLAQHKNFGLLVDAMHALPNPSFDLVIAGTIGTRFFDDRAQILPPWVRHAGFVSDGELRSLYERAACFVFPSLYEGFGLPPAEAMACGCPVLAADTPVLRDTCAGAALHFDPLDALGLSRLLERIVGDQALQQDLRAKSLERAAQLRWESAALALLSGLRRRFMPHAAMTEQENHWRACRDRP